MDLKDPERIWMSKTEALAYVQRVFPTLTENSLVSCHNGDFTRGIPDDFTVNLTYTDMHDRPYTDTHDLSV